jgi:outer membrane protein assembly factor BamB
VADGVVYAITSGQLVALDANTGATLWTLATVTGIADSPVVAAGTVYISTSARVYAVDIATQSVVWDAAPGGIVSVAAARLWVVSEGPPFTDAGMYSYRLTP